MNGFKLNDNGTALTKAPKRAFVLSDNLLKPENCAPRQQVQAQEEKEKKSVAAKRIKDSFDEPESSDEDEEKLLHTPQTEGGEMTEQISESKTYNEFQNTQIGRNSKRIGRGKNIWMGKGKNSKRMVKGEIQEKEETENKDHSQDMEKEKEKEPPGIILEKEKEKASPGIIPYWEICDDAGIRIQTVHTTLETSASDSAFNNQ